MKEIEDTRYIVVRLPMRETTSTWRVFNYEREENTCTRGPSGHYSNVNGKREILSKWERSPFYR